MDDERKQKVKAMCDAHWEYVESLIRSESRATRPDHNEDYLSRWLEDYLKCVGFHYKTAMEHGYKHGWTDAIGSGKPVACCCESPDVFKQWNEG